MDEAAGASGEAATEPLDDEPVTIPEPPLGLPPASPLPHEVTGRPAARWSPAPGARLGPLVLEERVGRGGMGDVWRAREPGGGPVAVKLLGLDWANDPRGEARLVREHAALEKLDHPAIVRARATGRAPDGRPWFSMELVAGARTLSVALREGLGLERALDALEDVAEALGHAHRLSVFHRDVKPSNILLDAAGRVRLVDFGLARVLGASRLTSTGDVWGTPGFTAPEQVERPDEVGPWTDVFALGATLHQVLAGTPPRMPLDLHPELALRPDTPPRLADLCARALSFEHEARPRDGDAFLAQLRAARGHKPPRAPRRIPAVVLLGAGAALALLAVSAGVVPIGRPHAPASTPAGPALPPAPLAAEAPEVAAAESSTRLDAGPPDPLPAGLVLGTRAGEVVNLADGSVLVWVPGGVLAMGAAEGDSNEGPVHDVPLDAFFIGKVELDWGRFRAFCAATDREVPDATIDGTPPFTATDEHPVFNVRLGDALAYCHWAGLRLPSEAEWEWAARGEDPARMFPWGPSLPVDGTRVANIADRTAQRLAPAGFGLCTPEYDDGAFWPTPVGSFPAGASWVGCLDLSGNVWEWTSDPWRHYPRTTPPGDPVQAVRGGSWDNPVRFVHSTHRGASPPSTRAAYLGFRVARDAR